MEAPAALSDIVEIYSTLLLSDKEVTMPIAAIEALIEVLAASDEITVTGTLSLLKKESDKLKAGVPNSISLSAGCDLFQQYLITSLRNAPDSGSGSFDETRRHLLSNGRLFVDRAKAAREKIALYGKQFINSGNTVLTHGDSRVVNALLLKAADAGPNGLLDFKVIYVLTGTRTEESLSVVSELRAKGVPVSTITEGGVAYAMDQVNLVIVGAEGVVETGGVISRLGTYQIAVIAQNAGKAFYVAVETHKFVRLCPLRQPDLLRYVKQNVVDFKTTDGETGYFDAAAHPTGLDDAVDLTPPKYIAALLTETGIKMTSAVCEELINMYS